MAVTTGLGRICGGLVSLYPKALFLVQFLMCLIGGITEIAMPYCDKEDMFYIFAVVYGFVTGPLVSLEAGTRVTCVGQTSVGTALGWAEVVLGVFTSLGPIAVTNLNDIFGDMFVPLCLSGWCYFIAAAILIWAHNFVKI